MYQQLINKETKLAVIGLGYVGLPIALAFARKIQVIGFDINPERIDLMKQGIDPSNELDAAAFENADIVFTNEPETLKHARFFIVAVPTPVDAFHVPDLSFLLSASATVGRALKKGDYVVFESTVYPGCTEEDCLPVIEKIAGLKNGADFKSGYSPERINPGDKTHTLSQIVKVVSGCDATALDEIAKVYKLVVTAGVHKAPSVKVAEAAKIIENTQRDLNIALMNELSLIFDKMGINTFDVLAAARTKWNFLNFQPGLVGGHCIDVDPYYLTHKAEQLGYNADVILAGRNINDRMAAQVAAKVVKHILKKRMNIADAAVLIKGATFKENISDIRNSKVANVVAALKEYSIAVHVEDPFASSGALEKAFGFGLTERVSDNYDAVIITVPHRQYLHLDEDYFCSITKEDALIADLKGIYRNKISKRSYFSL
ncbi:nucleotide sugar dehydrogenase [Niabella soli]|uniref:UDP-N-acetyl-D-galactosamine dehydrogenase n=1 Tax=Niabella soli DSM 19437 TaxID=929713 RepID=W0EZR9_9BACT|nr:nucleotide sugar dehydrogenase [Niabella soli]AHF15083.1 UDP-N-acetyl-D-galactosamine dehydrogenase [Niabella soli DSM 19437]